jgi:hypothetical protein
MPETGRPHASGEQFLREAVCLRPRAPQSGCRSLPAVDGSGNWVGRFFLGCRLPERFSFPGRSADGFTAYAADKSPARKGHRAGRLSRWRPGGTARRRFSEEKAPYRAFSTFFSQYWLMLKSGSSVTSSPKKAGGTKASDSSTDSNSTSA